TAVTSSVVTSTAPGEPAAVPQDFVLWSLFSTLFCNPCCFGFLALVFSIKARDRKIAQDQGAAETYGRTAKHLNIVALCLGTIIIIIGIVLLVLYLHTLRR
ncbi:IFM3 protein, partial [Syrrhaptes paradoxus]|nr:IFM3 protein [Syrrhaptes paradoxus]